MNTHVRHFTLCLLSIALLGIFAYHNSFQGVFLFDDISRIIENKDIQSLQWPWPYLEKTRRPLVFLTLAVNYAFGKLDVFGYHLFNLAIHILAAMILFGIIRQTCRLACMPKTLQEDALGFAWIISVLWLVHPLQTQSVTYIIQRAESMMGMFFLMTLYSSLRYFTSKTKKWLLIAWAACFLGGMTKEVMITAPVVVFLYDRAFISATFKKAFQEHRQLYIGLAATIIFMLLMLFLIPPEEHPETGFSIERISSLERALNQPPVILHYLRLIIWPHPLVFDYDWRYARDLRDTLPALICVLGLLMVSLWAYRRHPRVGFLPLSFFIILAPTSTVIPLKLAFEHRLYLPSACAISFIILLLRYFLLKAVSSGALRRKITVLLMVIGVCGLGTKTVLRNEDYHSALKMWQDTVVKRPRNSRAHYNFGLALYLDNKLDESIRYFKNAVRLRPDYGKAHYSLGVAYIDKDKISLAMKHLKESLNYYSKNEAEAHNNIGFILMNQNKLNEAIENFQAAIVIKPDYDQAENNLGVALMKKKKYQEALAHFQKALDINPDYSNATYNLGLAAYEQKKFDEAVDYFNKTIRLDPSHKKVYYLLGKVLFGRGEYSQAARVLKKSTQLNPQDAKSYANLGLALLQLNKFSEARESFSKALEINPQDAQTHNNFGVSFAKQKNHPEAIKHFKRAVEVNPNFSRAYYHLGLSYYKMGSIEKAEKYLSHAADLSPEDVRIHYQLGKVLAKSKKYTKARYHFTQAIRLNPGFKAAQERLEQLEKQVAMRQKDKEN